MPAAHAQIPPKVLQALDSLLPQCGISGPWNVFRLAGDASNRTYFRLQAGGRSFVIMKLADEGFNSPAEEFTKTRRKITELPFLDVQRYLAGKAVRVPQVLGVEEARGVLLLEDFGDRLFVQEVSSATRERIRSLYRSALAELERIAVIAPDDPRTSIAFSRSFDRELYNWEFLHFVEYALDQRLARPLSPAARQRIVESLQALTERYLRWENVFCHRDYHSRNLLVLSSPASAEPSLGVIDFQDALMAPLFYDLASLLRDSYFALEETLQDELVEEYRLRMQAREIRACGNREEFRRDFDLMGLHRNLKAAGRFCYIDRVKGKPAYLADVPRTLDYVARTLRTYEELRPLREELLPLLPEVCAACIH